MNVLHDSRLHHTPVGVGAASSVAGGAERKVITVGVVETSGFTTRRPHGPTARGNVLLKVITTAVKVLILSQVTVLVT